MSCLVYDRAICCPSSFNRSVSLSLLIACGAGDIVFVLMNAHRILKTTPLAGTTAPGTSRPWTMAVSGIAVV